MKVLEVLNLALHNIVSTGHFAAFDGVPLLDALPGPGDLECALVLIVLSAFTL
jgi:hypothetical protein